MKNIDNITISTILWCYENNIKNEKILTKLFKMYLTGDYHDWCSRFTPEICDNYRNCADCQEHAIEVYAKKYKKLFSIFRGELNG
jgi:hypothetical protein